MPFIVVDEAVSSEPYVHTHGVVGASVEMDEEKNVEESFADTDLRTIFYILRIEQPLKNISTSTDMS